MDGELKKTQVEPAEDSPLANTIRTGIKIAAWPFSAITAYFSSVTMIRNKIYKNIAQTGFFESSKKKIKTEPLRRLFEESKEVANPAIPDVMKEINHHYRENVRVMLESAGFCGMKDYWKGLNHNQRVEAGVFGITVGGIMLGAMLEIANNRGLIERLTRAEKKFGKDDPDIAS